MEFRKVVLAHDWMFGMRGGERVLEAIAELFPKAPIYCLFGDESRLSESLRQRTIVWSPWNRWPFRHNYQKLLPLLPWMARQWSVPQDTDLLITTSSCVINHVRRPANCLHLSHVFSPMRYMTDQFDQYFPVHKPALRFVGKLFRLYLQWEDRHAHRLQRVHHVSCNSDFVRDRISRFWNRQDAQTIHSFVNIERFTIPQQPSRDYFLCVSALTPYKRIDLAVSACTELGLPLKVVGQGSELARLRKIAGPNVEFLTDVSDEQVGKLMAHARAFIFPGVEDFGITPLESLACGTPVIALQAGGVCETLTAAEADFFATQSIESLKEALVGFQGGRFDALSLRQRATLFSKPVFQRQFREWVTKSAEVWRESKKSCQREG